MCRVPTRAIVNACAGAAARRRRVRALQRLSEGGRKQVQLSDLLGDRRGAASHHARRRVVLDQVQGALRQLNALLQVLHELVQLLHEDWLRHGVHVIATIFR